MHKELMLAGVINPTLALVLVVQQLAFPLVTKKRRRGRNHLQIPFPVAKSRQHGVVLHKLVKAAISSKGGSSMGKSLAALLLQTLRGSGALIQDHRDLLRTLKAGRPFA